MCDLCAIYVCDPYIRSGLSDHLKQNPVNSESRWKARSRQPSWRECSLNDAVARAKRRQQQQSEELPDASDTSEADSLKAELAAMTTERDDLLTEMNALRHDAAAKTVFGPWRDTR